MEYKQIIKKTLLKKKLKIALQMTKKKKIKTLELKLL